MQEDYNNLQQAVQSGNEDTIKECLNKMNQTLQKAQHERNEINSLLNDSGLTVGKEVQETDRDVQVLKQEMRMIYQEHANGKKPTKMDELTIERLKNETFDNDTNVLGNQKYTAMNGYDRTSSVTKEGFEFQLVDYGNNNIGITHSAKFDTGVTNLFDENDASKGTLSKSNQLQQECLVYNHLVESFMNGIELNETEQTFVNNFEQRIQQQGFEYQDGKLIPKNQ